MGDNTVPKKILQYIDKKSRHLQVWQTELMKKSNSYL